MYKITVAIIGTVFITVGLSSTAVAGEITGNGMILVWKGHSPHF